MSKPSVQVLSEHFRQRMEGRKLLAAVFCTYQFDPGFFEQEVLPLFLGLQPHQNRKVRLVQLEEALREAEDLAVYYDVNGLQMGADGSAQLDVRRIPVRHPRGIFHPKLVFALVKELEGEREGEEVLLVAALSANMTRSGWWENVEACHVEEVRADEKLWMKPELLRHLRQLRRLAPAWEKHAAVDRVEGFLKRVPERRQRTQDGRLCTHFLDGSKPLAEALQEAAGDLVQGWDLEVIAPFFDQAETCRPLEALLEALRPRKVRLMLPLDAEGQALVDERIHADCASWEDVEWALLPDDLRMARKDIPRYVHAKVYRFFNARDRREILYVGSANMTTAAHQRGNLECGFLVETEPDRRPTWWTEPLEREPQRFEARSGSGEAATSRGSLLAVRYHWARGLAEVFWMGSAASPRLVLSANGTHLADLDPLGPGSWQAAPAGLSERLRRLLPTTSLLQVSGEQEEELPILVMEEGMSHKPSLLRELTAEQILQYWATLSPEQRAAFIEEHALDAFFQGEEGGDILVEQFRRAGMDNTLFDRFAGVFHAFDAMLRVVREELEDAYEKDREPKRAIQVLFGRKFDSLDALLTRIEARPEGMDAVHRYVLVQSARQLLEQVRLQDPWLGDTYPDDWQALATRLDTLRSEVREELEAANRQDEQFGRFLDWFDKWFLRRAEPQHTVEG